MTKRVFLLISFFILAAFLVSVFKSEPTVAQINSDNESFYMFGSIERNKEMSGFFSKNRRDLKNQNWCVFIGKDGNVYKISLIDRNIGELFIDGKKIADEQIWKHTAEYKWYLEKFWRSAEIENESAEIDSKIRPIDRKIQALDKEIEKLDKEEEKLDKDFERNSLGFAETRKTLKAQQKKINEIQRNLEDQIEELSGQQEKLSDEQESLDLMDEMNKVLLQIGDDLKSLGVIKNTANLSFKLSNLELFVNGKKVSDEAFQLLKTKYIFDSPDEVGFIYRWKK